MTSQIVDTVREMAAEKQMAWIVRLLLIAGLTVTGAIGNNALQRLDRISEAQTGIAEAQARNGERVDTIMYEMRAVGARQEALYELHYRLTERVRALESRRKPADAGAKNRDED